MSPPAFVLVARCPQCGAALCVRYTRRRGEPFIGCEAFPACRFTAVYDEALQQLGQELATLRGQLARFCHLPTLQPAELDRALKHLIKLVHPDLWENKPATALAHEVMVHLNALRQRLEVA